MRKSSLNWASEESKCGPRGFGLLGDLIGPRGVGNIIVSMLNFEEICHSTSNQPFYHPREPEETFDDDNDESLHQPENKRRLTSTQVQFLEKSFKIKNKLEPERKIQLVKDLGLQPRQEGYDNLLKEKEKLKTEIVTWNAK
ncbi:uncharacterized protein A4U43_C10F660 [Asparagus officinalis]|uniref:Homeobox-leucine zipper protein n=1 Tax=Asparagus officinalis TaxID=4686 RepID=A0A5P1E2U0_ASPOF|nr:uncharacterized protein A4U43_C10F660 [Asparagus officinalis]